MGKHPLLKSGQSNLAGMDEKPLPLQHLKMRLKKTASESNAMAQKQSSSSAKSIQFMGVAPIRLVRPEPKPRRSIDNNNEAKKMIMAQSSVESASSNMSE
jgi:hypothetical protein